jgi:hexulose-6-phosphate isomerase
MTKNFAASAFNRREFVSLAAGAAALSLTSPQFAAEPSRDDSNQVRRFQFSVKSGMIRDPACQTWVEKLQLLKELGFDGIEYDESLDANPNELAEASAKVELPVQGLVNPYHWNVRLSDPDPEVRAKAVSNMDKALQFAKTVGASTVLLVPGKVSDPQRENFDQVWQRSIEGIRRVIPLAAKLGIRIGIENVWNQFLYQHDGPGNQSPDLFNKYVDEINSAWVGLYFDFSNHRKYGDPAQWLRAMGTRVIKCDTKDFQLAANRFCDVGEGDVPWADVRQACKDINYYGWVSSEVAGGDRQRLSKVLADLQKVLF